jgi:hypothetical protein
MTVSKAFASTDVEVGYGHRAHNPKRATLALEAPSRGGRYLPLDLIYWMGVGRGGREASPHLRCHSPCHTPRSDTTGPRVTSRRMDTIGGSAKSRGRSSSTQSPAPWVPKPIIWFPPHGAISSLRCYRTMRWGAQVPAAWGLVTDIEYIGGLDNTSSVQQLM